MNKWVKFDEKKPPDQNSVYIITVLKPESGGDTFFKKIPEERTIEIVRWYPKEFFKESKDNLVIYEKVWGFHEFSGIYNSKIIAWMPLPEPPNTNLLPISTNLVFDDEIIPVQLPDFTEELEKIYQEDKEYLEMTSGINEDLLGKADV